MNKPLVAALLLGTVPLALWGCGRVVGRGEKVGTVIKLSQEGFFIKTWEGEMVRGGMNGGSGGFSVAPLHFTVDDERLLPQVQKAFESQKEVYVTYEDHFGSFWFSECHDGCKFLTSIRER